MGEKVKPLNPDEILEKKQKSIPDEMLEAINEMIVKKWNGSEANFKQDELLDLYFSKIGENNVAMNRRTVFDNHWMDFEDIYREAGWHVEYDKPAYNESYDPNFTFKKKKK